MISGKLSKMRVKPTTPVSYELPLNETLIHLNPYLGKGLKLRYLHQISCQSCGARIKKSYQDGYCFPCTQKLAQTDLCMVKPERCHFHVGTCREPQWGIKHCMIPHVVYLAATCGLKVGITRKTNIPIRWIDQGATLALPLFEVQSRRLSGLIEVVIAKYIADKTNWRKMLTTPIQTMNLLSERERILNKIQDDMSLIEQEFGQDAIKINKSDQIEKFVYPILSYPEKIISLSFDKTDVIEGTLMGIKGQYLIFDCGVINIRKFSAYELEFSSVSA